MRIIGVGGQMQNGKDTLADYLAAAMGETWTRTAFAVGVKKVFSSTFDVDADFIEKWKVIKEPPEGFQKNVRQALQFIGDGFRTIQADIWIELCLRTLTGDSIISDCRYINELKRVHESGGRTILVWRPGKENDDPNGSEAQIRPIIDFYKNTGIDGKVYFNKIDDDLLMGAPAGAEYVDFFIRNEGTMEELYRKADAKIIPFYQEIA
jgi:hypothetical protein